MKKAGRCEQPLALGVSASSDDNVGPERMAQTPARPAFQLGGVQTVTRGGYSLDSDQESRRVHDGYPGYKSRQVRSRERSGDGRHPLPSFLLSGVFQEELAHLVDDLEYSPGSDVKEHRRQEV